MDSLLSLQTPTFPHPPPGIPIPTTSTAPSITDLLVPKREPLDESLSSHSHAHSQPHQPPPPQSQPTPDESAHDEEEHDLYSEFFRVSELFRLAMQQQFGSDVVPNPNPHPGDFNANAAVSDPNSQPGDVDAAVTDPNSRAIVAVPPPQESSSAVATPRRGKSRRKELVRVSDFGIKDQLHFREVVRRTRMIYDSLRALTSVEEEKRAALAANPASEKAPGEERVDFTATPASSEKAPVEKRAAVAATPASGSGSGPPKPAPETGSSDSRIAKRVRLRLRGDLRAASLMRERGLWLNRDKRIVGAIPGVYVGDLFLFRMELCVVGLHGQIQAGIDYLPASMSPNGEPIATSVIVSGGYEDDMELDDGVVIIYTGHGGQEKNSSRQASHQKLEGGNLGLERSMHYGIEVRVIRGMRYEGAASSSGKVYVYDGLYRIVDYWFEIGKSGFGVYKYKLWRIEGQAKMGSAVLKEARDIRRKGLDFKPMYCVSVDISNKRENVAVRFFNDIDDNQDPLCYEYLVRTSFPQFVFHQSGTATGCDCVDGCADGCFCFMKNGGEFPYNQHGILVKGKPLIFECGPFCSCPPHCRNRVAQKGLKNRLEVFRSRQTGWGVRSLDLIHAGAFICEYTGVVLTRQQAQILTMNGDSLIYPNRFSDRWAEWGDLSQIFSNYVRPSYPSIPPLDFSLDVSTMRNVACYISHSSTPNVLVQFVLYDHNNLMFPHLMLFAMENIPPMRELSLDYGVADEWTGKLSICN